MSQQKHLDKKPKNFCGPKLHQSASPILDTINNPDDLKKIDRSQLNDLTAEIRREIIRVVSRNGGHLASSLGAVELITALHYVLNTPEDKIVFDVGHQAYAHKILTGRRVGFEKLRQEGGISGFPKRAESLYDDFDTGHSSTSISAALGWACARDLAGDNYNIVAVIGDGALTGGMALEALNHAGALKKKLIVILNDNEMSIGPNVGGISEYLSLLTTNPAYVNLRKKIKGGLQQYLPSQGGGVISAFHKVEDAIKSVVTSPSTMFESIGFRYLGPFDGHDTGLLIDALKGATNLNRAVLMHVISTKGKGYQPAEDDPLSFHGVGAEATKDEAEKNKRNEDVLPSPPEIIEISDNHCLCCEEASSDICNEKSKTYSEIFGEFMLSEAELNKKLAAISAAMSDGTGLSPFFKKYPERSFDVGIAEQHAVTMGAGLAVAGFRPVVAIYSSFLQRAFDQLFHDVALQNLPLVLAIDRAGLVGEDGPTHHGGLDLSFLRILPNFTLMAPADGFELKAMLKLALNLPGPSAIRYPRGKAALDFSTQELKLGKSVLLKDGHDISLMAIGPQVEAALKAAARLERKGISASVLNLRFIKPLDREMIHKEAQKCGVILTLEENLMAGGLFGAVSETLAGEKIKLHGLGFSDKAVDQASQKAQRTSLGLDAEGIYHKALEILK